MAGDEEQGARRVVNLRSRTGPAVLIGSDGVLFFTPQEGYPAVVPIPIPDLADGLTAPARRLLATIAAKLREKQLRDPDAWFVKTWGPVEAAHMEDPSTSAMDYCAMGLRLVQDWVCRYPLIEAQGNFGTIDGDPPSGMRYTEVRLHPRGRSLLADPGMEEGDPLLPFPHLLCNGAWGHSGTSLPDDGEEVFEQDLPPHLCDCVPHEPIHLGELLSFLPPHNLAEVGRALVLLIDRPGAALGELLERIAGPDFPTGGLLVNRESLLSIYEGGEGVLRLYGRTEILRNERGKTVIVIHELPYGVTKTPLIEQIAGMVKEGGMREVSDIRDLTSREAMRLELEVRPGANPQPIWERLLEETLLRREVQVRMKVRTSGEPHHVGLLDLLHAWKEPALEALRRRSGSRSDELLRRHVASWIDSSDLRRTTIR